MDISLGEGDTIQPTQQALVLFLGGPSAVHRGPGHPAARGCPGRAAATPGLLALVQLRRRLSPEHRVKAFPSLLAGKKENGRNRKKGD